MTTMTMEVPDDLATQLQRDPGLLQALLREVINVKSTQVAAPATSEVAAHPVHQEIMDFLAASPIPEALVAFKISEAAQERLEDLLVVIRLQVRAFCGQPL